MKNNKRHLRDRLSDIIENGNSFLRIRNYIGILGMLLPFLCILGALLSPNTVHPDWWSSISGTYYSTPVLIMVLSGVAFFMLIYRGYNGWDTLVNTIAGIAGFGVVCFPCEMDWVPSDTRVGILWLPVRITEVVHYISAAVLFISFAINSICLFAKSRNPKKNRIYKTCGWIIVACLIITALNALFFHIDWLVMILETIMLWAFGTSWLVKGHFFEILKVKWMKRKFERKIKG